MVHMRANLLSTQQSSTKIQGTSRIFKTCLLVMLLSLAACLFSLLFEVFYCQSANNDNTEDCSDSWFIVLLCFVCTTAIAACSVCGCCGVGYGDSSWHKCMKDDSYKRINSLLVVVFGGGFGILIWPMLISEKMSDVLLEITVFCLIVACCAWSCLSCCTKTEEDMGDDEEDNEKRKALARSSVWYALKSLPLVAIIIAGAEMMRVRLWIYKNMTGIDYIFSPQGYYWGLETTNEALSWVEIAEHTDWGWDEDEDWAEKAESKVAGRRLEDSADNDDDFDEWLNFTSIVNLLEEMAENQGNPITDTQIELNHCNEEELKSFITGTRDAEICNAFVDEVEGCPAGLFYNESAKATSTCPPGFFCPEDLKCIIACIKGAACLPTVLNTTTNMCSPAGGGKAVAPVNIEDGETVCPGSQRTELCPKSSFCPTTWKPPVRCTESYYCPRGVHEEQECKSSFSSCPAEGMDRPSYYASIKFLVVAMSIFFVSMALHRISSFFRSRERERKANLPPPKRSPGEDLLPNMSEKGDLRMDVEFTNLGLVLNGSKKKVLNNVTGCLKSGRITAIMGPSGAGKTTFMNVIAGKASYGETTGSIKINGFEDRVANYSTMCGFVPQDDTMMRDMTVEENLLFYARMRLPKDTTNAKCREITQDVINTLGLSHVQHEPIGDETTRGISGGQRKRVNVGMEMVSNPSLLFLDEPTSGLDSATSYELLEALKELAKKGTNIVVVLHQPSWQLFQLFDDVLLLGKGGCTVYLGASGDAQEYFEKLGFECPDRVNPADFYMDVIAGKYPRRNDAEFESKDLFGMWAEHETSKRRSPARAGSDVTCKVGKISMEQMKSVEPIGFFKSYGMYVGRTVLQYNKHKVTFLSDVLMQLVAGGVVGGLYMNFQFKEINTMNFMLGLVVGLTCSLAELRVFGAEREVFWRESSPGSGMNLDTLAYFLAKSSVELVRVAVLVVAILCTFYPLSSPRTDFNTYFNVCYAAALMATGVPIMFSTSLDPKTAQLATVIFILIVNMMAGNQPTLAQIDKMGKVPAFISRMSYARWLDEALFVNEVALYSDAWKMPPAFLVSRDSVVARLIKMNYTEGMGDLNVLVMYYLAILFRVAAYLGLVAFNRDKRALPSFFDMIVEDIVTPFRELVVDLTLIGAVIPTNIRRNGIGASIRRGLGVSDQQAQQRVLDAANEVMRERVRGGTEEVGLDDLAEGDVDMRVSAAADEV